MKIELGNSQSNSRPLSPKQIKILMAVFVLLNVFFCSLILLDAAISWKSIYLYMKGATTTGVIVDFKSSGGSEPSSAAIVQFKVNDQTYTFTADFYDPQPNKLGDVLEVIYDPNNPGIAQVNTYLERWESLDRTTKWVLPTLLEVDAIVIFILVIRKLMSRKNTVP